MKAKQMPTTNKPTISTTSADYRVQNGGCSREERVRSTQRFQCERERKHNAAVTKRDQEEQLKRSVGGKRRTIMMYQQKQQVKSKPKPEACVKETRLDKDMVNQQEKTDEIALKSQLKYLACLSEYEFEKGFRQWMDQEGIAHEMHAQLRTDLINSFNKTSLGRLLSKTAANQKIDASPHCLLLSPLAMALHTLVAEFLHVQNCHYTLSVYCSEMPHRHTLPNFEGRSEFRFTSEELKQILIAVLGQEDHVELSNMVQHFYLDTKLQKDSLLIALVKCLVDSCSSKTRSEGRNHASTMTNQSSEALAANQKSSPNVDTGLSPQTDKQEMITTNHGRDVFVGPRLSESIHNVEKLLNQLIQQIIRLSQSCAPPVEVVTQTAFEKLLRQEIDERERLQKLGQSVNLENLLIQLPVNKQATTITAPSGDTKGQDQNIAEIVKSPAGPIKIPPQEASVPKMPQLHPEQLSSLARVRQSMNRLQKKSRHPQACMYLSIERMETLLSELSGCMTLLSNVLNLTLEQEHAVGLHKGFQTGYREGFSHGHFMGVQEGRKKTVEKSELVMKETSCQTDNLNISYRANIGTASTQTQFDLKKTTETKTVSATQTTQSITHHKAIGVDFEGSRKIRDSAVQTKQPEKTYEEWIQEMLNSGSGQIFLERVELSLNKALELQKKRLDELHNVKLRHYTEMLRLSRRKSSWRTLCRRVERDSQSSTEAKKLVHKIYCLLEHYESHHRILAEKIHETELAADQAARIIPIWSEADVGVSGTGKPPTLSTIGEVLNPTATTLSTEKPSLHSLSNQPGLPRYAATNIEMGLSYPYQILAVAAPKLMASQAPPIPASSNGDELPPTLTKCIPPASSISIKPNLHSLINEKSSCPVALLDTPDQPLAASFDEALLSAKNRMLSLERESDLLEQSFVSYLERTRSQKHTSSSSHSSGHHIRVSCLRESQQIHRTLDSFRDWHRRLHLEDQIEDTQDDHLVASAVEAPPSISSSKSLAEKEPDSYQFTNAIAVARKKLFNEMSSTRLAQPQSVSTGASRLLKNWLHSNKLSISSETTPIDIDALPNRFMMAPEVTITASSSNGEINHAINPAQIALDCSWSSSSSSTVGSRDSSFVTLPEVANPSRKLQRSMAKMHQLFGESIKPARRPMSAPLSGKIKVEAPNVSRPQTAPTISSPSSPRILYSQDFWKRLHL